MAVLAGRGVRFYGQAVGCCIHVGPPAAIAVMPSPADSPWRLEGLLVQTRAEGRERLLGVCNDTPEHMLKVCQHLADRRGIV